MEDDSQGQICFFLNTKQGCISDFCLRKSLACTASFEAHTLSVLQGAYFFLTSTSFTLPR